MFVCIFRGLFTQEVFEMRSFAFVFIAYVAIALSAFALHAQNCANNGEVEGGCKAPEADSGCVGFDEEHCLKDTSVEATSGLFECGLRNGRMTCRTSKEDKDLCYAIFKCGFEAGTCYTQDLEIVYEFVKISTACPGGG